jgi:hypothetical protein
MEKDNDAEWVNRADAFRKAERINRDELEIPSK